MNSPNNPCNLPTSFPHMKPGSCIINTTSIASFIPYGIAPAYVYLASDDSSYMTGQTIHVYS